MNLKTILNNQLNKLKPDAERAIDQAVNSLTLYGGAHLTPDAVRTAILSRIKTLKPGSLEYMVIQMAVDNFPVESYLAKGPEGLKTLAAALKQHIDDARL